MARTTYPAQNDSFTHIKEGMDVLDSSGEKVGTVKFVRFSDENPKSNNVETVSAPDVKAENTVVDTLAKAVGGEDEIPEELQERLLRNGYIRIGRGVLKDDGFATLDQIATVHEDHLHLKVTGKDLLKK